MKYLKIFEAFESEILGKTLKFLSKAGREEFKSQLATIAKLLDFPMSKYSDDYFQYLPFKKALELNFNEGDKPCDAKSIEQFDNGIEGEVCQGGMIKRNWGRGTRMVKCPVCDGTGVKPVNNPEIKWIKFWFDKDGNYLMRTGVDGVIRKPKMSEVKNYVEVEVLSFEQIKELPSEVKVSILLEGSKSVIATSFRWNNKVYMIQDHHDGDKPYGSNEFGKEWREYGRYSWIISSPRDYKGKAVRVEEVKDEVEESVNPYEWNAYIESDYRRIRCRETSRWDIGLEESLKGANFAIVLNYLDLKKSIYKKKSEIISAREEEKSGALALMSDEQIKNLNISRYLEEIGKRMQITEDLKDVKKTIIRLIGGRKSPLYIIKGNTHRALKEFSDYVYYFLRDKDSYYQTRITSLVKSKIEDYSESNKLLQNRFDIVKSQLKKNVQDNNELEKSEVLISLLENLEIFESKIWEKINSFKFESFSDIEVFYIKVKSIWDMYGDSKKLSNLRYKLDQFFRTSNLNRLTSILLDDDIEELMDANKELVEFTNSALKLIQ